MVNKVKFHTIFSINLLRFIKAHHIRPVSKGIHPKTGRTFWVFEMTDELSRILTKWSELKKQRQEKQ